MPLSKEQLEERQKHIGASDIPALLGYSSYMTAGDLFLQKTGRLIPEESSEAAKRGNRLEPAILDYAEEELAEPLQRNVRFVCKDLPILVANLDAFAPVRRASVEAKSTVMAQAWADDSEPPESVVAQVMTQMICAEIELAYVPVLLPYLTFKMYEVQRNPDLCNVIMESVAAFEKCLKTDTPPENTGYTLEVARRIRRISGKVVEVPASIAMALKDAREAENKAKKAKEQADAALRAAMKDGEIGEYPGGKVYLQKVERVSYSVAASEYTQLKFG